MIDETTDQQPTRSRRSHYVWRVGVAGFGGLSAAGWFFSDILRGHWPRVPVGFTSAFAIEVGRELLTVGLLGVVGGVLFGYAMWVFIRWFTGLRD